MEVRDFRDKLSSFDIQEFLEYLGVFFLFRNATYLLSLSFIIILLLMYVSLYAFRGSSGNLTRVFSAYRNMIIVATVVSCLWVVYMAVLWFRDEYASSSTPYVLVFSLAASMTGMVLLRNLYNRNKYLDIIPLPLTTGTWRIKRQQAEKAYRRLRYCLLAPVLTLILSVAFILATGVVQPAKSLVAFVFDNSPSMSESLEKAKSVIPHRLKSLKEEDDVVITTFPETTGSDLAVSDLKTRTSFKDSSLFGLTGFYKKKSAHARINNMSVSSSSSHIMQAIWKTYLGVKERYPQIQNKSGAVLVITTDGGNDMSNTFHDLSQGSDFFTVFPPEKTTLIAFGSGYEQYPFFISADALGYAVVPADKYNYALNQSISKAGGSIYFLFCMLLCCLLSAFTFFIKPREIKELNS